MIRLEMNDAGMVKSMCSVNPENRISAEELTIWLKVNSMKECLQDRKLQWFIYLEKMEENAWSGKSITKVSGSCPRRQPGSDLKERKASKDLDKDRNAWKAFIRNRPTHASIENRC